jgi:hypothetical protein
MMQHEDVPDNLGRKKLTSIDGIHSGIVAEVGLN